MRAFGFTCDSEHMWFGVWQQAKRPTVLTTHITSLANYQMFSVILAI